LITPPIGVNLFVVQGIRTRNAPFRDVAIGAVPFVVVMLLLIVLLVAFPGLALWLPNLFYGS
jgi:TRAP-type C4-dicarboxylate transport system permease large subunit